MDIDYKEYNELKKLGINTTDRVISLLKKSPHTATQLGGTLCLHRVTICSILKDLEHTGIAESLKVGKEKYYAIKEK